MTDALHPLLTRTLIVVAHPDDEAVTCAALMQRMQEPHVLFCTDGAPLDPYFWSRHGSRTAYSLLRQQEARLALSRVGVTKVEFLKTRSEERIIDQQLFERLPEAIEAVFQVVDRAHPQALLLVFPSSRFVAFFNRLLVGAVIHLISSGFVKNSC